MRYRGREDICHKTTDEARPDSDEFSFTEGFLFCILKLYKLPHPD